MLFSWNSPPSPSPTESKRLFYNSVRAYNLRKSLLWLCEKYGRCCPPLTDTGDGNNCHLRMELGMNITFSNNSSLTQFYVPSQWTGRNISYCLLGFTSHDHCFLGLNQISVGLSTKEGIPCGSRERISLCEWIIRRKRYSGEDTGKGPEQRYDWAPVRRSLRFLGIALWRQRRMKERISVTRAENPLRAFHTCYNVVVSVTAALPAPLNEI